MAGELFAAHEARTYQGPGCGIAAFGYRPEGRFLYTDLRRKGL